MKKTIGGLAFVALVAATMAVGISYSGAAAPNPLVVDQGVQQCANAGNTQIQPAVNAAKAGQTITVCPGDYVGDVAVNKKLNIKGATLDLSNAAKCLDAVANPATDPLKNSVVDGIQDGFAVGADDVNISGFTIQGSDNGIRQPGGNSGGKFEKNVLQSNSVGINFNSNGAKPSKANNNCLRDNNAGGPASGTGVYSDQGLSNAEINNNAFNHNDGAGVTLIGVSAPKKHKNVNVHHNTSDTDGDLVSIATSTGSKISNNDVTNAVGSAIFVEDGNVGLTINNNKVHDGDDEGININAGGGTPNTGFTIMNNESRNNATNGYAVRPDSLVNSTLQDNKATLNGGDGLIINGGGNTGNKVKNNDLRGNLGTHDCHDSTTPLGNTWDKNNQGNTQNVNGLCKKATTIAPADHA